MAARPIYLPPATVTPQVRAAEAAIKLLNPPLTVAGIQYANESDAALARRHEAEYQVRQAERLAQLAAANTVCVWCKKPFAPNDVAVLVGAERIHAEPCQAEFEAMLDGDDAPRDEFLCRGGCGQPMGDAGEICAECGQ